VYEKFFKSMQKSLNELHSQVLPDGYEIGKSPLSPLKIKSSEKAEELENSNTGSIEEQLMHVIVNTNTPHIVIKITAKQKGLFPMKASVDSLVKKYDDRFTMFVASKPDVDNISILVKLNKEFIVSKIKEGLDQK